jgi:hypothetical protein
MSKTLIGFTDEEIVFARSLIEFARTKLQEQHDNSHSGVDKLLINSWIISTSKLLTQFEETGNTETTESSDFEDTHIAHA